MSRSKIAQLAVAAALVFGAQSAIACSTAAWTGAATTATAGEPGAGFKRYGGRCSLKSTAIGQFVTDASPDAEPTYRARGYVNAGTATAETDIFRAIQASNSANVIRVTYDGANIKFYVNNAQVGANVPALAGRYYSFEVRWANTGAFTGIVQGNNAAAPTTVTGNGTAGGVIDTVQLGLINGAASGDWFFDEFDSRRTTDIGRLCKADANGNNNINIADVVVTNNEAGGGVLALGQPDCNENGAVNVADVACVSSAIGAGAVCAAN